MKRKINLIGIGTDGNHNLTVEAKDQIETSTILIGAKRMIESVHCIIRENAVCYHAYQPHEILKLLQTVGENEEISILFSGDSGFYSGARNIKDELEKAGWQVRMIPGIASVICMAARCHVPWEKAAFVSLHGTEQNVIHEICTHEHTFILLGGKKTAEEFLKKMTWYGMDHLEAAAGRDLSYTTEEFYRGTVREMTPEMLDGLTVLWVHHPDYDTMVGRHLEDDELIRGKVPMTKSSVRAIAVASLKLRKGAVLYDIGAGTGSVAIEAALQNGEIQVFAIERNPEGVHLIRENKRRWKTDGVTIVEGTAPEVLKDLPAPTHVFIGGSGKHLKKIIQVCLLKNPDVRIVMTAVSLETVREMTELLQDESWKMANVTQIQASDSRKMGSYHMIMAQNPVYVAVFHGRKDEKNG